MTRRSRSPRPSTLGSEDPAFYEALGRAIKVIRTEQGLSRKELAARAGVSYPYVADIETGRGRPSSSALLAIAEALALSPSELLARAESFVGRMRSPEDPAAPASGPASERSWFRDTPASAAPMFADEARLSERDQLHRMIDALPDRDLPLVLDLARRLLGGR
ncbi:MAG TPA: helix-turn-helix transcriptional regulator [Actinomycetota bacterium]|nr:helix-turn-helix transcriptional regulator [Actinomycetota bacterium]